MCKSGRPISSRDLLQESGGESAFWVMIMLILQGEDLTFQIESASIKFINSMQPRQKTDQGHFSFDAFAESPPDTHKQRIFSYKSTQIRDCMADQPEAQKTTARFYNNHIFHSTKKYQVPLSSQLQPDSSYLTYYNSFHKFTKPYGELTKFSDSINKNAPILRRGPCDIPITISTQNAPKCAPRNYLRAKGSLKGARDRAAPKKRSENSEPNLFEKTVDSQLAIFKRVLAKERDNKHDKLQLNNSMNRLLAAEAIQEQLREKVHSRSKTDHL